MKKFQFSKNMIEKIYLEKYTICWRSHYNRSIKFCCFNQIVRWSNKIFWTYYINIYITNLIYISFYREKFLFNCKSFITSGIIFIFSWEIFFPNVKIIFPPENLLSTKNFVTFRYHDFSIFFFIFIIFFILR